MLDVHLLLAVAATPLFGFTAAWLAMTVALTERTWPARLIAVPGVVGGIAYGAAGPLIYFTENVAVAPLFAGQAVAALFVFGTGVRLLARRAGRTDRESPTRSQAAPA